MWPVPLDRCISFHLFALLAYQVRHSPDTESPGAQLSTAFIANSRALCGNQPSSLEAGLHFIVKGLSRV